MAIRGIKTKIAFNVAILVLLSAIITDVLVVLLVQKMLVRQAVEQSRHILDAIGQQVIEDGDEGSMSSPAGSQHKARLIAATRLAAVQVFDKSGRARYQHEDPPYTITMLEKATKDARTSHQPVIKEVGMAWSGFWWQPRAVIISAPNKAQTQLVGNVSGAVTLKPIYQRVTQFNKPILLYIVINTIILTLVGLYRIFKLYLRPIDRIVRQADDYQEEDDPFFAFRQEDNQLNRLSSALNRMLNRIKADKETLKKTVVSLGRANSALKNAQKKIIQTEKMASVGRLASGIAHEIGNPIGIVLGYIDLLKKSNLNSGEERDFLRRTEEEVQRINTVIRQLLDLARPKDPEFRRVELNTVIEEILAVMRLQPIMSHIQFRTQFDQDNLTVWANADQLRQVFLNLLLNAADAIQSRKNSDDGAIQVQTICLDEKNDDQAGRIQIRFKDNGIGMNPETLDNIFDPFYTTKEPGKGTGLGLAVSYMIIEGMGGSLFAESKVDQGSTFIAELPIAAPEDA